MAADIRKGFIDRKDWNWILFLVLGGAAIVWALLADYDLIPFMEQASWGWIKGILWDSAEFMCNVIVTYETMLVASVIFFYSVMDNKRLGIPFRRLLDLTIGSHTIPILFMITLLLTVFMVMARSVSWKYTTYVCMGYILLVQMYVIINILLSTSYAHCKRIICRYERKRFMKQKGIYNLREFTGYLERAVHSGEIIQDKTEMLGDFLRIPFDGVVWKMYEKSIQKGTFDEKREGKRIYHFYFVNTLSAFRDDGGEIANLEIDQMYSCILDFLKEYVGQNGGGMGTLKELLKSKYEESECTRKINYISHMVISGVMNALAFGNARGYAGLYKNLLTKCELADEIRGKQIKLMVLFQEVLGLTGIREERGGFEWEQPEEWDPLKEEEIAFCADMWNVWMEMYDVPFYSKARRFNAAIQTMIGYRNASGRILRMKLKMKCNGERKSEERGIYQNTFAEK